MLAYLAVLAPRVILVESFLSFLGLGVREPLTSLGVLVADGARHLQDAPWLLIAPAALLMALLYGLNFAGEGFAPPRRTSAVSEPLFVIEKLSVALRRRFRRCAKRRCACRPAKSSRWSANRAPEKRRRLLAALGLLGR